MKFVINKYYMKHNLGTKSYEDIPIIERTLHIRKNSWILLATINCVWLKDEEKNYKHLAIKDDDDDDDKDKERGNDNSYSRSSSSNIDYDDAVWTQPQCIAGPYTSSNHTTDMASVVSATAPRERTVTETNPENLSSYHFMFTNQSHLVDTEETSQDKVEPMSNHSKEKPRLYSQQTRGTVQAFPYISLLTNIYFSEFGFKPHPEETSPGQNKVRKNEKATKVEQQEVVGSATGD
ncbi:hypothetical protein FF38_07351 [Lucilia cuprina]|uniref:Uncharacterized protein n=1 Tax=Lucilia cuprina TaxID=7375 RepID=A0A0L0CPY1_LUCCU|nr:hypothetical protein FF38_07351 [Lucilia cuprina]